MTHRNGSRIVPLALGLAMLAVILAAGFFPNAGTVSAQTSSCPYGGCSTSSSVPAWEYVSILVLVAAGVIVAMLFMMRRRRPPPATSVPAAAAGPVAGPGAAAPSGPIPPYIETPEDVDRAGPSVAPPPVTAPAGAVGGAQAAGGSTPQSDIDSLMAELDKISSDILKKAPKKGTGPKSPDEPEDVGKSP